MAAFQSPWFFVRFEFYLFRFIAPHSRCSASRRRCFHCTFRSTDRRNTLSMLRSIQQSLPNWHPWERKGEDMKKCLNVNPMSHPRSEVAWHTRFSIWWLRNFEEIIHFWTGFSWVWAIGVVLKGVETNQIFIKL